MAEIPRYGYSPGNRPERRCFLYEDYEGLRDRYGQQVRPICNCAEHEKWLIEMWHFVLPPAPKLKSPVAQRAWRILTVTEALAGMELDEATVHLWANVPGLLDSYMEPIWDDLEVLPKSLTFKGGADEARQCKEVFAQLTSAVDAYEQCSASGSREHAYLMPPKELLCSRECGLLEHVRKSVQFGSYEQWRKGESLERKLAGPDYEVSRIDRMSNTVPVHVGAAASKVVQVLKPIMDAIMDTEGPDGEGRVNAELAKLGGNASVKGKRSKPRGSRRKTPPQLLRETRERQAAQILGKEPNITARALAEKLECDPSTVTRLKAWKAHRAPDPKDPCEQPEGDE